MFFHLFVSSLISLSSGLQFSLKRFFTYLVSCIPKYLILFVAIVNGSLLMIWLLLVYKNACKFCTLIFYPETLLKLLIILRSWAEMMGSCKCTILSSSNRDNLTSSFLFEYPFFLFLAWLLWLELPVLYWIGVVREGTLVYCQFSKGMLLVFAHAVWYWLWVYHK